jgi:hypothetical protein
MGAGTDGICVYIEEMRAPVRTHDWFRETTVVAVAVYKGDLSDIGVHEEA